MPIMTGSSQLGSLHHPILDTTIPVEIHHEKNSPFFQRPCTVVFSAKHTKPSKSSTTTLGHKKPQHNHFKTTTMHKEYWLAPSTSAQPALSRTAFLLHLFSHGRPSLTPLLFSYFLIINLSHCRILSFFLRLTTSASHQYISIRHV